MIDYSIAIRGTKPGTKKENIEETKVYAVAQAKETLTFSEICEHIASHNSKFGRGDVTAVVCEVVDCLRELLLDGKRVQLGDLGTFGVSLSSTGAKTCSEFTAANIKKVNVTWAKGTIFKTLKEFAHFRFVPSLNAQAVSKEEEKSQTTIVKGDLS